MYVNKSLLIVEIALRTNYFKQDRLFLWRNEIDTRADAQWWLELYRISTTTEK